MIYPTRVYRWRAVLSIDCDNRLESVTDLGCPSTPKYYNSNDYQGRCVKRGVEGCYGVPPTTVTEYCYDGDQIIADYNSSGVLLRKYVYGPGIDEPICMIDVQNGNKLYYYHYDGLGSVVALSDEEGDIVERYSYDVFGAPTIRDVNNSVVSVFSVANHFMFTGRRKAI